MGSYEQPTVLECPIEYLSVDGTKLPADFAWRDASGKPIDSSGWTFVLSDDGSLGTGKYLEARYLKREHAQTYTCSAVFRNGDECNTGQHKVILKVNGPLSRRARDYSSI